MKRLSSVLLVAALVGTACGGGGDGGGNAEVAADACVETPAAELAATGALCGDTGLRPVDGGFSFANWAGPVAEDAVSVTTAIAIFGQDAVCAQKTAEGCVPLPAVQHWIDAANSQMAGGRCEGMAVLSQRIHDGEDAAGQLQDAAARTADLKKETTPVAASISRWWVSQQFGTVTEATKRAWQMEPSEVVAALVEAIKSGAGATIGLYDQGAGHAITPIAVTKADDGTFAVSVYDNNYAGQVSVLKVDPATETWTYDVGAQNSGAVPSSWSGGKGDIDYVVMADREGAQKVPWSDDDRDERSKGSARITVSTGGKSVAGLIVKVGDATIDSRDLSTVSNGIQVFPNRGGIGTGAMVEIPDGLADVKITPVVGQVLDDATTKVELAVSVDAPGPGSQFVTDTVEGDELIDDSYDDFSLTVSTDEEFENVLDVADDGEIEVGVAYEEEAAEITLEDGQDLNVVDGSGDEGLDIEVATAEGDVLYEAGFDGESDTGDIGVANVDIDEATGEATVDVETIAPASVDEEVLAVTAADDDPSEADSTNEPTSDSNPPSDTNPTSNTDASSDDSGGSNDNSPDTTAAQADGSNDDSQSPANTESDDSPETTRATAPVDTDPPATQPEAPTDTAAGGED